jgi:hypothetical protein
MNVPQRWPDDPTRQEREFRVVDDGQIGGLGLLPQHVPCHTQSVETTPSHGSGNRPDTEARPLESRRVRRGSHVDDRTTLFEEGRNLPVIDPGIFSVVDDGGDHDPHRSTSEPVYVFAGLCPAGIEHLGRPIEDTRGEYLGMGLQQDHEIGVGDGRFRIGHPRNGHSTGLETFHVGVEI